MTLFFFPCAGLLPGCADSTTVTGIGEMKIIQESRVGCLEGMQHWAHMFNTFPYIMPDANRWSVLPRLGLRHIDTAEAYQNEAEIGQVGAGSSRWCKFARPKDYSFALTLFERRFNSSMHHLGSIYADLFSLMCYGFTGRAIRDSQIPREQLFIATKATSVALGMAEATQHGWRF